jgi:hypothetical protein
MQSVPAARSSLNRGICGPRFCGLPRRAAPVIAISRFIALSTLSRRLSKDPASSTEMWKIFSKSSVLHCEREREGFFSILIYTEETLGPMS